MDAQHDAFRLGGGFVENRAENVDDEIHRGVVVVQQQDAVHGGLFELRHASGLRVVFSVLTSHGSLFVVAEIVADDCRHIVAVDLDDAGFALVAFLGVGGVRGVDHDVLAEFAADRAVRSFGRVGGAENRADFGDGVGAFVDQDHAFDFARSVELFRRAAVGTDAGHEFHDAVELVVGEIASDGFLQHLFAVVQNDLVFVFEKLFRLLCNDRREFLAERLFDGAVELQRFGDGHLVDFAADDAQRGAAEHVDDVARARARTAPVVRLDDDKRALASLFILGTDDVVDDVLFVFDEVGDDFEAFDAAVDVRRGEDRGFEVEQGAVAVEDEVAVGVADRVAVDVFAAVLGVRELADDFIEFAASSPRKRRSRRRSRRPSSSGVKLSMT